MRVLTKRSHRSVSNAVLTSASSYERTGGPRLKREEGIRWVELLDKFKSAQERAGRSQGNLDEDANGIRNSALSAALSAAVSATAMDKAKPLPDAPRGGVGGGGGGSGGGTGRRSTTPDSTAQRSGHKHRSALPNLGRLGIGSRKNKRQ